MADEVAELLFEAGTQLQPGLRLDMQAFEDGGRVGGNTAAFVVPDHPTGPVEQFQVVGEDKGQALGHVLAWVADKGEEVRIR